ncbi:MAG TPA: hypothetical protein VMV40_09005 [Acidiferrobacter sp.]|nr:hypothetical protein [Acidiferrobacter sp.]
MLWFKRPPEANSGNEKETETVAPVALAANLDGRIFALKFARFLEIIGESGGIDPFVASLTSKRELFARTLARAALPSLDLDRLEVLVETVMPARKRVWPSLAMLGITGIRDATAELLYGAAPLADRMAAFADAIPVESGLDPKAERKVRRAIVDLGAEMLHFRAPVQYPLMTRWVWDQNTHAGAVRELVSGGDALDKVMLGSEPGVYEAARRWVAERMAENGMYRDPEFVVDLFLAHAYADYMRALSSGMGFLNADFGGKEDPLELVTKLLGIDAGRRTQSRVKKVLH